MPKTLSSRKTKAKPKPVMIEDSSEGINEEYEVEAIRSHKPKSATEHSGVKTYRVKWRGYDENENTDEPADNLAKNCEYILEKYWEDINEKKETARKEVAKKSIVPVKKSKSPTKKDTSPRKQIYEILQESMSEEKILVKADAVNEDDDVDMENDMPNTPEENLDLCNLTNDSSDIENEVEKTKIIEKPEVPESPIVLKVQKEMKEVPWIAEEINADIKSAEPKTVETIESSSSKSEKHDSAILVPARKRKMSVSFLLEEMNTVLSEKDTNVAFVDRYFDNLATQQDCPVFVKHEWLMFKTDSKNF